MDISLILFTNPVPVPLLGSVHYSDVFGLGACVWVDYCRHSRSFLAQAMGNYVLRATIWYSCYKINGITSPQREDAQKLLAKNVHSFFSHVLLAFLCLLRIFARCLCVCLSISILFEESIQLAVTQSIAPGAHKFTHLWLFGEECEPRLPSDGICWISALSETSAYGSCVTLWWANAKLFSSARVKCAASGRMNARVANENTHKHRRIIQSIMLFTHASRTHLLAINPHPRFVCYLLRGFATFSSLVCYFTQWNGPLHRWEHHEEGVSSRRRD